MTLAQSDTRSIVAKVGAAVVACLAFAGTSHAQGTAYASDSGRQFYSINLATGAKTFLRQVSPGVTVPAALAFDCVTGITYTSNTFTNVGVLKQLYTLNVNTGQATAVGPYGDLAMYTHALEINTRTGHLYAVSHHNSGLYYVNKSTGAATLIGPTGFTGQFPFASLGFDSTNNVMYGINAATISLYRINLLTGAATLIGPLNGPQNCGGMTFSADDQTMYIVDNDGDNLYSVNLSTGAATLIGPTGAGNLIGFGYNTTGTNCPARCPADFNSEGGLSVQDIFDFLTAWFGSDPRADFNGASGVSVQDVFDFLGAWFAGCP